LHSYFFVGVAWLRDAILIAYSFPPDNAPGAIRPARFAKYLDRFGYRTSVITAYPSAANADPWVKHVPDPKPKMLHRMWRLGVDITYCGWIRPAIQATAELIRQTSAQVLISTYPPLVTHLVAMRCKQRYGVRWVADFRDPLAGSPLRDRLANKLLDPVLERTIFENADAVIANTDAVADMWREKYPKWREKVVLIWNGYDPEDEVPVVPPPKRDHKVIAHVGHIYAQRHPGPVLEALSNLMARGEVARGAVKIVCVGTTLDESGNPEYFARFTSEGIAEFRPRVPRSEAIEIAADADYLLLLDVAVPGERSLQVPSKVFDYARLRRPILTITAQDSPLDRILEKSGLPGARLYWHAPAAEQERKLEAFLNTPAPTGPLSPWFESSFDCVAQTGALADVLDRVCEAPLTDVARLAVRA
jgi:glycosyltransferase involved in cell wall biosynthesis